MISSTNQKFIDAVLIKYDYNPITGEFITKSRGVQASPSKHGYIMLQVKIDNKITGRPAHRIAWMIEHGVEPLVVDHINGIKHDNRITNLRNCTPANNARNRITKPRGAVKFYGVTKKKDRRHYVSTIKVNGVDKSLGSYETAIEAARAYDIAAIKYHGEFATINHVSHDVMPVRSTTNSNKTNGPLSGYKSYNLSCLYSRSEFIDDIKKSMTYCPSSGLFTRSCGSLVGGVTKGTGYIVISFKRKRYLAHRLAFLLHHGHMPKIVDHIDGDRTNNKIDNLRVATSSQNGGNRAKMMRGVSRFKGVSPTGNRWRAIVAGKYIGSFRTELEAASAYNEKATEKWGEFAKINTLDA